MKRLLVALPLMFLALPAHATGGLTCRTAGPRPITISIGYGHVRGAPLLHDATRLIDNGRTVPTTAPQWWLDDTELRLLLVSPDAVRGEAIVRARRDGAVYDGSLWRGGKRHWVRCRES